VSPRRNGEEEMTDGVVQEASAATAREAIRRAVEG
jgi:hypothetical protein